MGECHLYHGVEVILCIFLDSSEINLDKGELGDTFSC